MKYLFLALLSQASTHGYDLLQTYDEFICIRTAIP